MSGAVVITTELDHLDQLGAKAFAGLLVRKDLVRKYSRQYPVPTYVVEFLLGRYCASTDPAEIEEGLQIVEKQLQGRTVRTGEEELFKARCRDQGSVKIIDIVRGPGSTPAAIPTWPRCPAWRSRTPRSTTTWCAPTSACSPMASTPR
jgi:predicted ATP-dependent Lon-type protease